MHMCICVCAVKGVCFCVTVGSIECAGVSESGACGEQGGLDRQTSNLKRTRDASEYAVWIKTILTDAHPASLHGALHCALHATSNLPPGHSSK